MHSILYSVALTLPLASSAIIPSASKFVSDLVPRADAGPLKFTDMTPIPGTAKADNTFNDGTDAYPGLPPQDDFDLPKMYQARDIDIPIGQLFHGKINFFRNGDSNSADGVEDVGPPGRNDSAEQTACGIPDMAFSNSKVAIHPYFLKYAGLDRYCQQDVCVSFWTEGHSDMIAKVTDICDPSVCTSPEDIMLPRGKVAVARHKAQGWRNNPQFQGDQDPEGIWWFLTKCIADGNAQASYTSYRGHNADNWFTTPPYPNKNSTAIPIAFEQQKNNQKSYPARGWQTYKNGLYPQARDYEAKHTPITDWVKGSEPAWEPIAGGRGPYGGGKGKVVDTQGADTKGSDTKGSDIKGSDTAGSDMKGSDTVGNGASQNTTTTFSPEKAPMQQGSTTTSVNKKKTEGKKIATVPAKKGKIQGGKAATVDTKGDDSTDYKGLNTVGDGAGATGGNGDEDGEESDECAL